MLTSQIGKNGSLCKCPTLPRHAWPKLIRFNLSPLVQGSLLASLILFLSHQGAGTYCVTWAQAE